MDNPYQSPSDGPRQVSEVPGWYHLYYRAYWPAWWIGVGMIVASWLGWVDPICGWLGFGLTLIMSLSTYVVPGWAGIKPDRYAMLDSRILRVKDEAYRRAMGDFAEGATLIMDGVAFGFRPNNEIACGIVASSKVIDELSAAELIAHAESVFDHLKESSPEFASMVRDSVFRISILDHIDHDIEICRFVAGEYEWLQHPK